MYTFKSSIIHDINHGLKLGLNEVNNAGGATALCDCARQAIMLSVLSPSVIGSLLLWSVLLYFFFTNADNEVSSWLCSLLCLFCSRSTQATGAGSTAPSVATPATTGSRPVHSTTHGRGRCSGGAAPSATQASAVEFALLCAHLLLPLNAPIRNCCH